MHRRALLGMRIGLHMLGTIFVCIPYRTLEVVGARQPEFRGHYKRSLRYCDNTPPPKSTKSELGQIQFNLKITKHTKYSVTVILQVVVIVVGVEVLKYLMVKQAVRLRRDGVYKDKSHSKWWTDFSHVTSVGRARVGSEDVGKEFRQNVVEEDVGELFIPFGVLENLKHSADSPLQ